MTEDELREIEAQYQDCPSGSVDPDGNQAYYDVHKLVDEVRKQREQIETLEYKLLTVAAHIPSLGQDLP